MAKAPGDSRVRAAWRRLNAPIFQDATDGGRQPGAASDVATATTYNYLRLGMLIAVAALGYSLIEEYQRPGVHCFLGSVSGYYYTPARPVFIGVMLTIGFALMVMKGKTLLVDWLLTVAGIMSPLVAFIPTSDDAQGVCRPQMLNVGRYEKATGTSFFHHATSNNLHALAFTGYAAIAVSLIAALIQARVRNPRTKVPTRLWVSVALGSVLVVTGSILLHSASSWVLQGHAVAAVAMFGFLAAAAIANGGYGLAGGRTKLETVTAWIYLAVGLTMVAAGLIFLAVHARHKSGHIVLYIEAVEIFLFAIFWTTQTIEKWDETV